MTDTIIFDKPTKETQEAHNGQMKKSKECVLDILEQLKQHVIEYAEPDATLIDIAYIMSIADAMFEATTKEKQVRP